MSRNSQMRYQDKAEKLVKAGTYDGAPNELEEIADKIITPLLGRSRTVITKTGDSPVIQTTTRWGVRRFPIAWGFPCDEVLFSLFFSNLMGSAAIMPWDDILIPMSTYLPSARNTIHQNFVETCNTPYLMMLDSDVLPPPNFLERLLAHKKDVVGGYYRKKGGLCPPVVYDYEGMSPETGKGMWVERTEVGTGLEKVAAAGAGCWLMSRAAALAVGPNPYDMSLGGEDLTLCLKLHEAGIDTWVDWSLACAHSGIGLT